MRRLIVGIVVMTALATAPASTQERENPANALEKARAYAEKRDFQAAYDTLEPFLRNSLDDEVSWEIAAEMGRAAFHCARYKEALVILRNVVASRPVVLEPALYLGAASYILGDRPQTLAIIEAVLQSGTVDLYRAVTLPGEKAFLADPEVREILDRYSRPVPVDAIQGACMGISLGAPRTEVVRRLGVEDVAEGDIAARAGPRLIWIWTFDDDDFLAGIVLHPQNLWRYTPFRVVIGDTPMANTTPTDVLSVLGPPQRTAPGEDDMLVLSWDTDTATLDLLFRRPENGRDGPGLLEIIRLSAPLQEPPLLQ